jgi:class 3 adenylate cyclase
MTTSLATPLASWRSLRSLPTKVALSRISFLALVLLFLALTVISYVNATSWIGKPFAGFLINQRLVVVDFGRDEWTGLREGMRYPDKILKADGRPIVSDHDLYDMVRGRGIGERVTYLVEAQGKLREVTVSTMRFTGTDVLMTFGLDLLAGTMYMALGLVVFFLKPDTRVSWAFFMLSLALALYFLTGFDVSSTHYLIRLVLVVQFLIPASFIFLSLLFPLPRAFLDRHPVLLYVPFIGAALLSIPHQLAYPGPVFVQFNQLTYILSFFGVLALVASALHAYFKGGSILARQRAKVFLFGAALAFPLPTVFYILPFLGQALEGIKVNANFLTLPLLIFPASIAFAITKHNLFDVDQYIKRTVGYGVMTVIVGTGYLSVQVVLRTFILEPLFGAQAERLYPLIFALLVVFFFNPINRRVQEGVDRLFFRKQYDYKATVASIGDTLASLMDLDAIISKVIYTVRERLFLDKAGVVLLDNSKKECHTLFMEDAPAAGEQPQRDLCLSYNDPLLSLLAQEKKLLTIYDIEEDPQYAAVKESCGKAFSQLGASLAIPLFHQNSFIGALTLGYKKSGHFYSRDDIDLLKTISTMTVTAIEQAREKEQRGTLMQLFSKHVSSQVAEALWQQRDQFLDGGRPRSQKLIATVMFTDLQGFTTVSEKLEPQALMDFLNTYMELVARMVMEHGGVVDDYFGDGVKVNFGVPVPRTTEAEIRADATNAVNCALALEQEMRRLNAHMKERNLPTLRMRVGIYTGPVVAGSLGSADRMKYTTLGDTVNTASRLESFDKELYLPHLEDSPCRILIGESTLLNLNGEFETQRVGELTLKGKQEKIAAYCLLRRLTPKNHAPAPQAMRH